MEAPNLLSGFTAGFLSFISPCVLPLVPSYLSFISGETSADIRSGTADRGILLTRTIFFALGFSMVFMAMGFLLAGLIGSGSRMTGIMRTAGGSVVILLGLNLIFNFLKILNREARYHAARKATSFAGAFLFGAAFGAGWSPCIGPILGSILFLAGTQGSFGSAALLLGLYSLGFSLPFFAMALFFRAMTPVWDFLKRHGNAVRVFSGLFLVAVGSFMVTGTLSGITSSLFAFGFELSDAYMSNPFPFRIGGSVFWALASGAVMIIPLLQKKPLLTPLKLISASAFALLFVLEAFGIFSSIGIIASWLVWSPG